ncbi:MAG: cytochrome C oxidase subunit IV family protein [Limisphaerales bacterium]
MSTIHLSKKTYFLVWATLLLLLFATWAAAEVNLGKFNNVVALTIGFAKMFLVLLFFMHVKYEKRLTWVFAAAGFIWLIIMIGLTMGDYITRYGRWHTLLTP